MKKFLPKSQFSILALGFILIFTIYHLLEESIFHSPILPNRLILNFLLSNSHQSFYATKICEFGIVLFIIFLIAVYLRLQRRVAIRNGILIIIGVLFGILYNYHLINKYYLARQNLQKNFRMLQSPNKNISSEVQIHPLHTISGNLYLVSLKKGNIQMIIATDSYDDMRKQWSCPISALRLQNTPITHYQFRTLLPYGTFKLVISSKHCKFIKNHKFPNQLVKQRVRDILDKYSIQPIYQGIALGLLFGESKNLNADIYDSAKKSGTLHLFAASGLHLGILIGALFFFSSRIFRLDYYLSICIPLTLGFYYLYILNFPVSLTRAYFFALAIATCKILFRKIQHMDLLVASCFIIILFKPESYLSIGFNLSFTAVAGIFFLKPKLDQFLFHETKNLWTENLTVSLSATLGTFFSCWYFFPGFSFGGVIANLFLVPLTGILLPLLYLNIFISFSQLEWISMILWPWTDLLLRVLVLSTEFSSATIGFYTEWSTAKLQSLAIYILILIAIIVLPYSKKGKLFYRFFFILAITGFFLFGFLSNKKGNYETDTMYEHFSLISISDKASLFILDQELYMGGYCKTEMKNLKKKVTEKVCNQSKSIRIDHESCLPLVRRCYQYNKNLLITLSNKRLKDWKYTFPLNAVSIAKKNSLFQIHNTPVLLYKDGWDPKWLPKAISKKKRKGILVLLNDTDETDLRKKSLGLASDWTILDKSEFARFSLLQSQENPRNLIDLRSKPSEILGTELSY